MSTRMDPTEALFSSTQSPNPSSFLSFTQDDFESTVFSFLLSPDPPTLSLNSSSFDRIITKLDDDYLIDRAQQRVSDLHVSIKRCLLKRATYHNSLAWSLPPDLTTKIFSMLDAKSLMLAGACCTQFNESAMNPLCYSHFDFPTAFEHENDQALATMINRAGNSFSSLKLGHVDQSTTVNPSLRKSSNCLALLCSNQLKGNLLRSLHIYNSQTMSPMAASAVILACSNLIDLKIVGLSGSVEPVLAAITKNCRFIENLFLKHTSGNGMTDANIKAFASSCPNLSSLTLIGFLLNDALAHSLVTCFTKLTYLDLSDTFRINGSFLRDLGSCCKDGGLLKTLILRNNIKLKEIEVLMFLNLLINGDFKFIQYMDVSGVRGLVDDEDKRTSEPNFPMEELKKERPSLKFVAEFPPMTIWRARSLEVTRRGED